MCNFNLRSCLNIFNTLATIIQEYEVQINRAECGDLNTLYIEELKCLRSASNRSIQVLHGYTKIVQGVKLYHIFVRVQVYYKFNSVYKPIFGEILENFCGFVNKTAPAPVISIFWDTIRTKSSVNHTCPYTVC